MDAGLGPDDTRYAALRGGQMLGELRRIGATPESIRHLAISHLHLDHSGWVATLTKGVLPFPTPNTMSVLPTGPISSSKETLRK